MQSVTTNQAGAETTYACVVCDRKFKNSALGYVHYMSHFGNVFCSCCKRFVNRSDWPRHCQIEHSLLSHECQYCPYLYAKKNDRDKHVARKHIGPWYLCMKCKKRFHTEKAFKNHGCKPFSKHVPSRTVHHAVPSPPALLENGVKNGGIEESVIFENERRGFPDGDAFMASDSEDS